MSIRKDEVDARIELLMERHSLTSSGLSEEPLWYDMVWYGMLVHGKADYHYSNHSRPHSHTHLADSYQS